MHPRKEDYRLNNALKIELEILSSTQSLTSMWGVPQKQILHYMLSLATVRLVRLTPLETADSFVRGSVLLIFSTRLLSKQKQKN
jgi:hypothetical protein